MPQKLLLATRNPGKVRELISLLQGIPFQITTLEEEGIDILIKESGVSFGENARFKATFYAQKSSLLTLAEDSGLEVDALEGKPGPLSARYAGEKSSDRENIALLLSRLKDIPWERRSARFRCVIALASPKGEVELFEGECPGFIPFEPKGERGFGYDPIFYLPEIGKTMAELSLEEKNKVSHRGRAAQKVRQALERLGSYSL